MDLVAGEIGKEIIWYANPQPPLQPAANPVSLTGATCTIEIQDPAGDAPSSAAMTVSEDGTYATYTTTGTDFPTPGLYYVQMIAVLAGGQTLKTRIRGLQVGATL